MTIERHDGHGAAPANVPEQSRNRFVDLAVTGKGGAFSSVLTANMCVGPANARHMFGGIGLASGIVALERACRRPVVWATAHFYSFASQGERLRLQVEVLSESRNVTHATALGRAGRRPVFRVSGALGGRPGNVAGQWSQRPPAKPPESCPVGEHWRADPDSLHGRLEIRVANGRYGRERTGNPEPDGRLLLWVRPKPATEIDAAVLAVVADLLPNGVGNALGLNAGGISLDNTLRILRIVPTSWVLAEICVDGIESGVAHGVIRLFAESGALLAVGSQSLALRVRNDLSADDRTPPVRAARGRGA